MTTKTIPSNAHTDLLEAAITAVFNRIQQEVQTNPGYECKLTVLNLIFLVYLTLTTVSFPVQHRDYLELNSLFAPVLARALEVVETCEIKQYISDFVEHLGIIEVFSDNGKSYKFYLGINYCPCPSFIFDVLKHKQQYTCKHNLAARLAITLNRIQIVKTSRLKFKQLLKDLKQQADTTPA